MTIVIKHENVLHQVATDMMHDSDGQNYLFITSTFQNGTTALRQLYDILTIEYRLKSVEQDMLARRLNTNFYTRVIFTSLEGFNRGYVRGVRFTKCFVDIEPTSLRSSNNVNYNSFLTNVQLLKSANCIIKGLL